MIRWLELDRAVVPGGAELRLMQRGTEFSIMAGGTELMNSRLSGSEEALASLACARLLDRDAPHILVGGLGMGFTLRAVQAARPDATITVAELVPAVIGWARGPLAPLFAGSLEAPGVEVVTADVGSLIRVGAGRYDAILLDVDNGPAGLSRADNDGLYATTGLRAALRALRPGGVLAVWSSGPSPAFTARLHTAGFAVEEVKARAHAGRGARHLIWIATRPR